MVKSCINCLHSWFLLQSSFSVASNIASPFLFSFILVRCHLLSLSDAKCMHDTHVCIQVSLPYSLMQSISLYLFDSQQAFHCPLCLNHWRLASLAVLIRNNLNLCMVGLMHHLISAEPNKKELYVKIIQGIYEFEVYIKTI